ncbi:uncharacterized protein LOC127280838 isoform X2 [Leptopilina boulardi]|uniref:uncharacterized protein LOC127280838 isoform X2 n=1 Tax=Leptopilina boulardi TaxID=63433 RepID=UPI0021F562F1|nr:uncharacterized protein LOC127280838 isoform X2 [Leptopilina boulardi]XP_051160083.1 uncharacterized protein LOC127280838 isoform X2 [Leptopilina boulardi]
MDSFKNPLETVQLIPIAFYVNILSDFLIIQQYLEEFDRNKQIPIINALYEYLQDYQNDTFKKMQLIRNLLNGSDMYGEKEDEYVDIIFVNVLFDYIISSLVFDKYGNIYGFFADTFCKAENLEIEEVLNIIRINLQNASFDNEYGNSSTLSDLSVARIYNDIILPLFPVSKDNVTLLSLDYIYAQAGSMFLRAGRINSYNYVSFESNSAYLSEDNLFNEYLTTGHAIEKFILTDETNFNMLKAFALPALSYFIINSKYLFIYENMANIISDASFWETAFKQLFTYTTNAFDYINSMLNNDNIFKINMGFTDLNKMKKFYRYSIPVPSNILRTNTSSFLSSFGTNIKSVLLKSESSKTVNEIVPQPNRSNLSIINLLNRNEIFENICSHITDPGFYLTFITKDKISVLEQIIFSLKEKTDFYFTVLINSLLQIKNLTSNSYKSIDLVGENRRQLLFIHTLNNRSNTGYGYKFIFVSDDISKIAELRTLHEFKEKKFLIQITNSERDGNKFIALDNKTFSPDHAIYEINNQLRNRRTKLLFFGIPIPTDDYNENCSYIRYLKNRGSLQNVNFCQRRWRLFKKYNYEEEAINYIVKNTTFSTEQAYHMLKKFTFPDNATLMRFIKDWQKDNSFHEPIWSKEYIIDEPDLLDKLRYDLRFEEHNTISEYEAEFRINSLYSKANRRQIENNVWLKNIIKQYNEQKASFSVSFHDYYAIRNYATTGYRRITRGSLEAKLMKMALYKLAIRQSEEPDEDFDMTLFRVETKSNLFLKTIVRRNNIILQKFTQTSPTMKSALQFASYPPTGYINIIYEMIFNGPFLRAKILQFYDKIEENVILLPGTEFIMEDREFVDIEGLGRILKVKLKLQNIFDAKFMWYKNIMNEIAKINF